MMACRLIRRLSNEYSERQLFLMMLLESHYVPYEVRPRIGRGRALFFAPHPDDEVFGCCGALLQHLADGDAVQVVVVTDGAYGDRPDALAYRGVRERESRAAADILGYNQLVFWGLPDRGLIVHDGLVERIRSEIIGFDADWVYAPSWWEVHPDHAALSAAVTSAVRALSPRATLVLYEVGVPLQANCLLDLTDRLDLKKAAIAAFQSQLVVQSYDRHILALNVFRTYTLPPSVEAAEAYRIVSPFELDEERPCPMQRACWVDDDLQARKSGNDRGSAL
ncbi:MAG: PIG-L family deacetylase [Gammaproteobacteria bacterium]|nr:PIG-L family deacetylase [Gammaproteobacteria bacterium]